MGILAFIGIRKERQVEIIFDALDGPDENPGPGFTPDLVQIRESLREDGKLHFAEPSYKPRATSAKYGTKGCWIDKLGGVGKFSALDQGHKESAAPAREQADGTVRDYQGPVPQSDIY